LVEKARYKNCFVFKYSPRPGTVAIKRFADDVPEEVKRFRNNDLLRLQNRITHELNRELLAGGEETGAGGRLLEVLCEGPSGWGGGPKEAESVVAGVGHNCGEEKGGKSSVELGGTLLAGLRQRAVDRHGSPYIAPKTRYREAGWVQLSGRTTHDQVVVFDGPAMLAGRIIAVRAREAHGMTIFGELAEAKANSYEVAGRI
jgi:tRNA-2-methylthio-N6-dimethylallyladenosine synthase